MGKKEEFVKEITNIEDDFAQWYTDIVRKAELADYTDTKGCIAIRPYGYAIWENIQNYADKLFKEVGVTNLYMPVLIPESMLEKEKDHVEGFAPEVAWVTMGGGEELEERLCIRAGACILHRIINIIIHIMCHLVIRIKSNSFVHPCST